MPSAVVFKDAFKQVEAGRFELLDGITVAEWLEESGFNEFIHTVPTLVILNGEALLEEHFDTELKDYDILTLVPQPGFPFLLIGFLASVVIGGYALYTAMTADVPEVSKEITSTNYNISYRGNRKKPGDPIPVAYGKTRIYPDLSAQSYKEYDADGEEILHQLFEFSQGYGDITDLRYEETPLSDFADAEYEILQPGQTSKLFPKNVNVVGTVSDIELETADFSNWYTVCEAGDVVSEIALDFVAPAGWYLTNQKGSRYPVGTFIRVNWQEVGNAGNAGFYDFHTPYTWFPWRHTEKVKIGAGRLSTAARYEVRVRRLTAKTNEANVNDTLIWTGLRGFIPSDHVSTTTRAAVKIRSSKQLGNTSLQQFSGVFYRKLPVWNGSSWTAIQSTKHPVWAFCDALRANYGGNLPDEYLDLAELKSLADAAPTAEFNGIFDTKGPLKTALAEIARCMLARAVELPGAIHTMVVDEQKAPSALYTTRAIVKDSFSIKHVGHTTESTDSVIVRFKDENQEYRDAEVKCTPSGSSGTNPAEVTVRGVTNPLGAAIIGFRMANENRYRRTTVEFQTGIEGYLPFYGDTIQVQHPILANGLKARSGDIISKSGNVFVVQEDLSDIVGDTGMYVFISGPAGESLGPYTCNILSNVTFDIPAGNGADTSGITFEDGQKRPQFAIGEGSDFIANVKVTKISQSGDHLITIEGAVDNPNAYIYGGTPTQTTLNTPQNLAPVVSDLRYSITGLEDAPDIRLTWKWAKCDYAIVLMSTDNKATWARQPNAHEPFALIQAVDGDLPGAGLWFKIIGMNSFQGNSAEIQIADYTAPAGALPAAPPVVVSSTNVNQFIQSDAIGNNAVDAGAIFISGADEYPEDTTYNSYTTAVGQINQQNDWKTFANFSYDMTGVKAGQELLITSIVTDALYIKPAAATTTLLDVRALVNGTTWYYYAVDHAVFGSGTTLTANKEYNLGGISPVPLYPARHTGKLEVKNITDSTPVDGINTVLLQFRLITDGYAAATFQWKYGVSRIVIGATRA